MSSEITKIEVPIRRYPFSRNTMAFPRELRDAIPELPTYVGRVLELDSMSAQPTHPQLSGPHVQLKLVVKETGKLNGEFTIRVDLESESARALAATLTQLADQADAMKPGPFPF